MYPEEYGAVAECFRKANQPECTAVAKPFPKGICEPARRKIFDQAKFLSKEMFMGCWAKPKGLTQTLIYKKRRPIKSLLKKLFYIKVFHYKVRKLFCCHRRSSVIWKGKCNGSGYVFF